jgi:protein glucosyltransferase
MGRLDVNLIVIIYLILCPKIDSSIDYDSNDINHEKTKYFREENDLLSSSSQWEKYIKLIEKADENHSNQTDDHDRSIFNRQIHIDLSYWKNQPIDDIQKQLNNIETIAKTHRLTLYQIINHRLYRQTDDQLIFPARNYGIEHFLLNIIDTLPDMEFLLNTYDWPQNQNNIPILSFSKSLLSHDTDILYPAWSFWDGGPALGSVYPTGIGRWDIMRQTLNKARQTIPWSKKESRGFFRGSRTSSERDPLVLLSRSHPELLDAQYTKNQAWKSDEDTLGYPPASELKHEEFCQFKYLFNFRGVAASFRLRHLFLCGSLVLHVGSDWIEFFYNRLEPWYHYIPITTDLHDVEKILLFVQNNDRLAGKIARQGRDFIWNYLTMENVELYWKELLLEYHQLFLNQKSIVKKSNLIQVHRRPKP